jgi:hypothetical protein
MIGKPEVVSVCVFNGGIYSLQLSNCFRFVMKSGYHSILRAYQCVQLWKDFIVAEIGPGSVYSSKTPS